MKKIRIILSLLPFAVLTGCSFGASIDTLMAPPKLSVEQEQIFAALTKAEGSAISLKYPKSGKYLSAFIIEDLDGDGGNEELQWTRTSFALIFSMKKTASGALYTIPLRKVPK